MSSLHSLFDIKKDNADLNGWIDSNPIPLDLFSKGRDTPLENVDMLTRFRGVYTEHYWSGGGAETRSGVGSTRRATAHMRRELVQFIKDHDIRTIIDVPCGDMNWMAHVLAEVPHVRYFGADIVPELIRDLRERYQDRPHWSFEVHDATAEIMPTADLVISREALFHLPSDMNLRWLRHVNESGSRFFYSTTNPESHRNAGKIATVVRATNINLELPPYNLPPPLEYHDDDQVTRGRKMGVWKLPFP